MFRQKPKCFPNLIKTNCRLLSLFTRNLGTVLHFLSSENIKTPVLFSGNSCVPIFFKTVEHRFRSPENSSARSVLFKKVEHRFLSPENSSAPVLFKTLEHWFPSPENSSAPVFFKTVSSTGFLLLRTVVHQFSSKQ